MKVSYRKLVERDIVEVTELIKKYVYFSAPHPVEKTKGYLNGNSIVVVSDGAIVGFACVLDKGNNVLILKLIVIHPEFRGKGIGKELAEMMLGGISRKSIVAECWIHPTLIESEVTSDVLLKKFGFAEVISSSQHWKGECTSSDYCPFHDNGCICRMKVLVKHIS